MSVLGSRPNLPIAVGGLAQDSNQFEVTCEIHRSCRGIDTKTITIPINPRRPFNPSISLEYCGFWDYAVTSQFICVRDNEIHSKLLALLRFDSLKWRHDDLTHRPLLDDSNNIRPYEKGFMDTNTLWPKITNALVFSPSWPLIAVSNHTPTASGRRRVVSSSMGQA